jgi:hypothetical protein
MIDYCTRFLSVACFVSFFLLSSVVFTQNDRPIEEALVELDEFQEVYISLEVSSFVLDLATVASIDYFENSRVYLYANSEAFQLLEKSGVNFRLERRPGVVDFELNMLDANAVLEKDLTQNWDFYPDYDAYVALMYHFEAAYPQLVKIHDIGTTVQGRSLLFAQIGAGIGQQGGVPQFMYTSTMHGDETAGFVTLLRLIHHLISNYGTDLEITSLMNMAEIWICPNENPDGTYTNNNATINGATRANANGVDLNRNYPTPHPNPSSPPISPVQPETQAMIDFVSDKKFIMAANIHGGIELVNFPFDSWKSTERKHADHNWWEFVMKEFVDTIHTYSAPDYMTGRVTGITHGGDWYVIYGGRQDYLNYFHSCREFTFEMSNKKVLNPELLPVHWEYTYRSLINYIRQATYGFHGFVKDAATGQPLFASLELVGYDEYYSHVTTSTPLGYFSRPVMAGTYDLKFVTDDYPDMVMPQMVIDNHQRIDLNVIAGNDLQTLYAYSQLPEYGVVTGSGIYPAGYLVKMEAKPRNGFVFLNWVNADGEVVSEDRKLSFGMPSSNVTLFAVFQEGAYDLTVAYSTGTGEGQLTAMIDYNLLVSGQKVYPDADVLFIASPSAGYRVDYWEVNGEIVTGYTGNEFLYENLTEDITVVVNFTPADYLLSVKSSRDNAGEVNVTPEGDRFEFGETITLTANPFEGYMFNAWVDDEDITLSQNEKYSFRMPARDVLIVAVFEVFSDVIGFDSIPGVRVYPNPARDHITIEADFIMQRVEMYDELGRIIMSRVEVPNNVFSIPLMTINPGIYLLRIYSQKGWITSKIQVNPKK